MTPIELTAGLRTLAKFPWAHLADAIESRFSDRASDVLVASDVVALLEALGFAVGGDVKMALAAARFLFPHFEARAADPNQLELPLGESANGS